MQYFFNFKFLKMHFTIQYFQGSVYFPAKMAAAKGLEETK